MYQIYGINVNEVFPKVINLIQCHGVHEDTRNGPVLALPEPLGVAYYQPRERVLFCPERGGNPFLNFFDGLFSIQPLNDAKFMFQFQDRFREYSDDGKEFHGHYGSRLSGDGSSDNPDQLDWAIHILKNDPTSRRVVLQLFLPTWDLFNHGHICKDIPCNVSVALRIVNDRLTITVFNRSNDIMWGMLGANVVQFSMLQEYIAVMLGKEIGPYHQISNNAHVYLEMGPYSNMSSYHTLDLYHKPWVGEDNKTAYPPTMVDCPSWLKEVTRFVETNGEAFAYHSDFLEYVAAPALRAWKTKSRAQLDNLPPCDWKLAFLDYATRKGWSN